MNAKRVVFDLGTQNGNAFHLLGKFAHEARQAGWSKSEIESVRSEAMAGNYDHLLQTLIKYVEHPTDIGD